jgi:predicted Zn-dependent protease with MMP-like domain
VPGFFEQLVEEAIAAIPLRYRSRMKNVAFVIEEDAPTGSDLLGLYEGRPLTERSVSESFTMPDRITIYKKPHERMARSHAHLRKIVNDTVWHEVAHYFGLDEGQVSAAERRRALMPLRRASRGRRSP